MRTRSTRALVAPLLAGTAVAAIACASNVSLFATDLDVQPDTAQAGDTVAFVFHLRAIPSQTLLVRALVNGTSVVTIEAAGLFDGDVSIDLGDAANLIAQYGVGTRTGQVEVRSLEEERVVRTSVVEFVLQ